MLNADEFAYQLENSGPSWIFTTPDLLKVATDAAKQVNIPLSRIITFVGHVDGYKFWKDLFGRIEDAPRIQWTEDHLKNEPSYILYSSGTTGRPKGVMQSHYNWVSSRTQHMSVVASQPSAPAGTPTVVVFPLYATGGVSIFQTNMQAGLSVDCHRKSNEMCSSIFRPIFVI